jgi:hypothetical protein
LDQFLTRRGQTGLIQGVKHSRHPGTTFQEDDKLAKPNYQYEKRQKELAKKRKQEEKRLRKLEQTNLEANQPQPAQNPDQPSDAGDSPRGDAP